MEALLLAFVAGLVTILNPCVLPLVPVLFTSALKQGQLGPLALVTGIVASFSTIGLAIIAFGFSIGIDESMVRMIAGWLLLAAGVIFLVPKLQSAIATAGAPISNVGNRMLVGRGGEGMLGQFSVGALLGVVWAPCVGPTLGVAIAAASQGLDLGRAFLTFLIFGLGIATSALAIAYTARRALAGSGKIMAAAKTGRQLFAISLILVGILVISGTDKRLESALLDLMPQSLVEFTTRF